MARSINEEVLTTDAMTRLRSFIERVERLEADRAAVMTDIKEVFLEAKGEGYDVKIMRRIVKLRAQDRARRQEEEAILDLYIEAIGGL